MNGWIKLHRKTLKNPIVCKDADHLAVWCYILLNATHEEIDMIFGTEKITLSPGQLITGKRKMASELHVDESKVRRIINLLKNDAQIDAQTNSKGTLITVLNWDKYQNTDAQNDEPVTHERRTSDARVTHENQKNDAQADARYNYGNAGGVSDSAKTGVGHDAQNDESVTHAQIGNPEKVTHNKNKEKRNKEGKNNKPPISPFYEIPGFVFENDEEFDIAFRRYIDHRKKMGKPLTEYAVKLAVGKLNKLASDKATKLAIIEQSIDNVWQGLFELKENAPRQPKKTGIDWESV